MQKKRFTLIRDNQELGDYQYSLLAFNDAQPGDTLRDNAFPANSPCEYTFTWCETSTPPCLMCTHIPKGQTQNDS